MLMSHSAEMKQHDHQFIQKLPKAELHVHIEGTFEPELMFAIAQRNHIKLPYKSVDELRKAYQFNNLQDFLNIYYQCANVLRHEQDFYDLTWAYLEKASSQGVLHAEIFFDPQTHTNRGIQFEIVINGITKALTDGQTKLGISSRLIMCFLRHLEAKEAMKTLEAAIPFKEKIIAVGLDSSEIGNPPSKFQRVFEKAHKEGFLAVAHAGEEGSAFYIWEALKLLHVRRVDHGNHALDDKSLVEYLTQKQIPLTICPLSNIRLKVVKNLKKHPLKKMMKSGLLVCINSDDPAYFGGYIGDNYQAIADALLLSKEELLQLAKNSFQASFLNIDEKKKMIEAVETYGRSHNYNIYK